MALDVALETARSLNLPPVGVRAALALHEGGATVPFIARYRKEATGGLDEVQLRAALERGAYLAALQARRATVLAEIEKQGKLTPELRARIEACASKAELEDLYLPFKPKRRTRAQIARERGLAPLAERILAQPDRGDPAAEAAAFVDAEKGIPDAESVLRGARDIVAEHVAEDAGSRAFAREVFSKKGVAVVEKVAGVAGPTKFDAYERHSEPLASMPSHRYLAICRGEAESVLAWHVEVDADSMRAELERRAGLRVRSPFAAELRAAVADAYARLLAPSIETEVREVAKERADVEAVRVFGQNLRALLLAAPVGPRSIIGIDPGQRTGCKVAVVDASGRLLEHTVLLLVQGEGALRKSRELLAALIAKHRPFAIAVGNGTHGRETLAFAREVVGGDEPFVVSVNEAGASVYSASEVAREEHPDLDLTVRGAISIARRLQDPLAELVKIEPKSIGVGQYQHDVQPALLEVSLDGVVESCVNQVGVELNTASAHLLRYVAGIGPVVARKIVAHREASGPFASRAMLRKVSGVGPKTFEQAAGFLRVRGGAHPLDASAVHPERYAVVEAMAKDLGVPVGELVGNGALAAKIDWRRYASGELGEPTLRDILAELARPGRDPREAFEPPKFRDDVRALEDLREGMVLEGVVTNVTAFGAFVDVGVHQDGLVHVSQLADRFVRDPAEVCKPGDKLTVRVLSIDLQRKRIALTARSDGGGPRGGERRSDAPSERRSAPPVAEKPRATPAPAASPGPSFRNNPFEKLKRR